MTNTILITGASGFIGHYLCGALSSAGRLIGLDITDSQSPFLDAFHKMDVRDEAGIRRLFHDYHFSYVVHAAANKNLVQCEANVNDAYSVNVEASLMLHEMCREQRARFVFLSSDIVFDGRSQLSNETCSLNPINNYGKWKTIVENELIKDSSSAICRTALVFGALPPSHVSIFESVRDSSVLVVQSYIIQHLRYRLSRQEPIHLPANEFCSPTSGLLIGRQLRRIVDTGISGIFHCCGGERISRYEFGKRIAASLCLDTTQIDPSSSDDPLRPRDVSMSVCSSESRIQMKFETINEMLTTVLSSEKD